MKVKSLNRVEASNLYKHILNTNFKPGVLSNGDQIIREDILEIFEETKQISTKQDYAFDLAFSIRLYKLLNQYDWFNDAIAADYDFWRYLAVKIMPDIIYFRHGENIEYFYAKNVRIYPSTMYWYIKLSFNETIENTYDLLSNKVFTTDTILNLVERPGRSGVSYKLTRAIIEKYARLSKDNIEGSDVKYKDILRKVFVLNTAKMLVIVPEFYNEGIKGYVEMLFNEALKGSVMQ